MTAHSFDVLPAFPVQVGELPGQLELFDLTFEQVVDYLASGAFTLGGRHLINDKVAPSGAPVPVAYVTDGTWVWPVELLEYVRRYKVALPLKFLSHISRLGGVAPVVSPEVQQNVYLFLLGTGLGTDARPVDGF
jgi:hypothetical protein